MIWKVHTLVTKGCRVRLSNGWFRYGGEYIDSMAYSRLSHTPIDATEEWKNKVVLLLCVIIKKMKRSRHYKLVFYFILACNLMTISCFNAGSRIIRGGGRVSNLCQRLSEATPRFGGDCYGNVPQEWVPHIHGTWMIYIAFVLAVFSRIYVCTFINLSYEDFAILYSLPNEPEDAKCHD